MKNILYVRCSPVGQTSESDRLAQKVIGLIRQTEPSTSVIDRFVGGGALSHVDAHYAGVLGGAVRNDTDGMSHRGTIVQSDSLIEELERADIVVIATPMHNFTVPSSLKAWIDHIVRVHRTFTVTPEGKVGNLPDRPVFVAVSSGGRYSGARARQPDFLTPYLIAILGTVGLRNLVFFSVEGTALGSDALGEARKKADEALLAYFCSARA